MSVPIEKKRNIALVGHLGVGKTILSEALLFTAGVTTRMGTIEDGNTISDRDPEEVKRRYSIKSSVLPFTFEDAQITVIDTPGYLDFAGEMISALHVVDAAVVVVSGSAGVEPQPGQAWRNCDKLGLPRLVFVSGLDKENSSWDNAVASLQDAFGKAVAPLAVMIGEQTGLKGVINVLKRKAYIKDGDKVVEQDVPAEYKDKLENARLQLVESIVELDEGMMERYLADEPINDDELLAALKAGTQRGAIYPVIGGSGKLLIGVRNLLDLAMECLPDPCFKKHFTCIKNDGSEEQRALEENAPFTARVFKISLEGQMGEVFWMRVYSGKLRPGDTIYNSRSSDTEKISTLLVIRGKTREDVTQTSAGDIVGTVKLKSSLMGDTLSTKDAAVTLPAVQYPTPVAYETVDVADKNDLEKVISTLNHLAALDPTLKITQDEETKEQVVSGSGQEHLAIAASAVKAKTNVEIKWRKPRIPYRETITDSAEAQGKLKKQTGGRGKYGDVHLRLEPQERGTGYEFVDAVVGGVVPSRFIPAVEKGIVESLETGPLSGSRVIDVKVTLFYGSYHSVDSDELSFKVAAAMGFKIAFEKCRPVLLEPIYDVTIYTPDKNLGDVMADINTRRGRVAGMDQAGNQKMITAQVPLAELYQYINTLRSLTEGQGYYEMKFSQYEQVPSVVQAEIVKAYAATRTADKDM